MSDFEIGSLMTSIETTFRSGIASAENDEMEDSVRGWDWDCQKAHQNKGVLRQDWAYGGLPHVYDPKLKVRIKPRSPSVVRMSAAVSESQPRDTSSTKGQSKEPRGHSITPPQLTSPKSHKHNPKNIHASHQSRACQLGSDSRELGLHVKKRKLRHDNLQINGTPKLTLASAPCNEQWTVTQFRYRGQWYQIEGHEGGERPAWAEEERVVTTEKAKSRRTGKWRTM